MKECVRLFELDTSFLSLRNQGRGGEQKKSGEKGGIGVPSPLSPFLPSLPPPPPPPPSPPRICRICKEFVLQS